MDHVARIEMLEAENDLLRERLSQLEDVMGVSILAPIEWRLTAQEARVFGVLWKRQLATKDAILAALYRDLGRDEAEPKITDVFICKLRRKLKPFGVEVATVWGQGWSLSPAGRVAASRWLGEGMAA